MVGSRVLGMRSFFEPRSVAVAGVSTDPNKLGTIIFGNLVANRKKGLLKASVYALNPAHEYVGDQRCYPSIESLPEVPELLVVAVPESRTVGLVEAAAKSGVKATIVVTSGYAEVGRGEAEERIAELAAKHGMRVLGPNTIGLVDTKSGVDSLFLRPAKILPDGTEVPSLLRPLKGGVAIITQSGHLGETIVEELAANEVGIRALVGTGNQADVSVEDVIEYFAEDPHTRVITLYIEGLREGRRFMETAYRASRKKPVVAFKVGKTSVGARAALTHTASLVGDYDVWRAAFKRSGVVEARDLQELVDYSISLSMLPPPAGKRLAIVTNAGGVGAIAADEAQSSGLRIDPLGEEAVSRLRSEFRDAAFISNVALGNPIDLTATAKTQEFVKAVEVVASLPQVDLLLVLPTHQTPDIDYDIAQRLAETVQKTKKPVCMCVIGRSEMAARIHREFMEKEIPSFPTPERAVRALAAPLICSEARKGATEVEVLHPRRRRSFRKSGPLSQQEVARILGVYGVREPRSVTVRSPKDFDRIRKMGFPVACKLLSKGLLHKSDAGGVVLDVKSEEEAESCFERLHAISDSRGVRFEGMLVQEMVEGGVELLLGGIRDPTFGPVVTLAFGGIFTELIGGGCLAVAPVTPNEVKSMLAGTKLKRVLEGYRGGPKVRIDRLCDVVSDFSRILVENPGIDQIEVNPLVATKNDVLAIDARAIVAARH